MSADRARKEAPAPIARPVSGTRRRVRPERLELQCTSSARPSSRWPVPTKITVHENGTAVARYGEDGFVRFADLGALLAHHALRTEDVEPAAV